MSLQIGQQIEIEGRTYTLKKLLGQGGMGAVYKAQGKSGVWYAIKELRVDHLPEADQQTLRVGFLGEANALRKIRSVRIPRLIAQAEIDGAPLIVMTFIPGENLAQIVEKRRPLDESRILCWLRDIAEAVEACHKAEFIHGDIKPENIRIRSHQSGEEHAYLVDFGVAVPADVSETTKMNVDQNRLRHAHTALFSAPEKFGILAQPDYASDIFSIGATFHYLFTGRPLWHHVDRWLGFKQKRISEINPEISAELNTLLYQCIELDPKDRPSLAKLLEISRAPRVTASKTWAQLPIVKRNEDDVRAFEVPLLKKEQAGGKPNPTPGPKYVAYVGTDFLLAGWPSGRIERIPLNGKQMGGLSWSLDFELHGLSSYLEDGKVSCLAYGIQRGETWLAFIPDICGSRGRLPQMIACAPKARHVWRDRDGTYLLFEEEGKAYIGEVAVRGKMTEPAQLTDTDEVPGCRRARAVQVMEKALFVAGIDQDDKGRVWGRDRAGRRDWQEVLQIGTPLAMAARREFVYVAYKLTPDVFIAAISLQGRMVGRYRPGLTSLDAMSFDESGDNLWIARDDKLLRVPRSWLAAHETKF